MVTTRNLSLVELRRMLKENERAVGADAQSTKLLRRLVVQREHKTERPDREGTSK
jgi:hypothetical protein